MADSDEILDPTAAIQALEEWKSLTNEQKQIILAHVAEPSLSKNALAARFNVQPKFVYRLFSSKAFDRISLELAEMAKQELRLKALQTLDDCLASDKPAIRLAAAKMILGDSGVIKEQPKQIKKEQAINVTWQAASVPAIPVQKVIDVKDES